MPHKIYIHRDVDKYIIEQIIQLIKYNDIVTNIIYMVLPKGYEQLKTDPTLITHTRISAQNGMSGSTLIVKTAKWATQSNILIITINKDIIAWIKKYNVELV